MTNGEEKVSFWRSWGIAIACWAANGLLNGRMLFLNDRDHANYLPTAHYFVWSGVEVFSWSTITPLLFLFARRFPFERQRWLLRTVQYAVLTALLVPVHTLLQFPAWFYTPDQHQPFLTTMVEMGRKELIGTVEVFLSLYILTAYQNTRREARRQKLREAELESRVSAAELQMLRMQLHPHFLFNALQAATVLVHEDAYAAENVLQRLSGLLRVALDDMRSLQVPLSQEITFVEHYVEIQKQRFGERLHVRFDIPADTLAVPVPTLLLQPLVENAIEHGIGKHKGSDVVEISACLHGEELVLEVQNHAPLLAQETGAAGHGVGLKNTRARLEQMYGDQAALQLLPLAAQRVCARVRLPVESSW